MKGEFCESIWETYSKREKLYTDGEKYRKMSETTLGNTERPDEGGRDVKLGEKELSGFWGVGGC